MTITQDPWSNEPTEPKNITCSACAYKGNEIGSTHCYICRQSLERGTTIKYSGPFKRTPQKQLAPTPRIFLLAQSKRQAKKQSLEKIRRQKAKTLQRRQSLPRGNYNFLVCLINFRTQLITFWALFKKEVFWVTNAAQIKPSLDLAYRTKILL
jgi:hypothetical protein